MPTYSVFKAGSAEICFLRLTFHTEKIPRDIGSSATNKPLPSRSEKPTSAPDEIEIDEKM
jgi:hypothetical protein